MRRNELKIHPNYKPVPPPDTSEWRGGDGQEYSHLALDVVGDKLFLRIMGDRDRFVLRPEITTGTRLEFDLEVGRKIGQAILDLCKEEEAE